MACCKHTAWPPGTLSGTHNTLCKPYCACPVRVLCVHAYIQQAGETELLHCLHEALLWQEHARSDGLLQAYGMATRDSFRHATHTVHVLCMPADSMLQGLGETELLHDLHEALVC